MPKIIEYLAEQGLQVNNGQVAIDGTLEQKVTVSNPTPAAGALTLTAAQLLGGLITIDPTTTDTTVTTPTASAIRTALSFRKVGSTIRCFIRHTGTTAGVYLTLAGGSGVTLSPTSIILGPGETVELLFRCTNATAASAAFTAYLASTAPASIGGASGAAFTTSTVANDSAAFATADLLNNIGTITPTAARSKATPTAAALISLLPNPVAGASFDFYIKNAAAGQYDLTITAGASVTLSPTTIVVKPGDIAHFRAILTSASALTIHRLEDNVVAYPVFPVTLADDAAVISAAMILSGILNITPTADRSKATDTAAAIIALLPVAQIGQSFQFKVRNLATDDYDLTITAGASVTLAPTSVVVKAGQTVNFEAVLTSASALTIYTLTKNTEERTGSYSAIAPDTPLAASQLSTNATIISNQNLANSAISLVAGGPEWARCLRVTILDAAGADLGKGNVVIVGTDINGVAVTETLLAAGWSDDTGGYWHQDTVNAFATVTSVTPDTFTALSAGNDKIAAGYVDIFALPTRPGGILTAVLRQHENANAAGATTAKTVGTVDKDKCTVVPASASNAQLTHTWIYTYI